MKKIFAIALALVMVLSMASAFAAATLPGSCSWGSWDCPTTTVKCGIAKAEVVQYTLTNNCYERYEISKNCPAVVKGIPVFYAIKVTFEENVNQNWFEHENTKLVVTTKDLVAYNNTILHNNNGLGRQDKKLSDMVSYNDVKNGGTFWVRSGGETAPDKLIKETDDNFKLEDIIFTGVAESTSARVCANVAFKFSGIGPVLSFGGYDAQAADANTIYVKNKSYMAKITVSDGKLGKVDILPYNEANWNNGIFRNAKTYYGYNKDGLLATMVGNELKWESPNCGEAAFLLDVFKTFKFDFSTCITADGIKSFFGWDDDGAFKHCVTWNKNAVAIVNPDCKIEIPKTGDVSVVAYAVMALVAAAGAMGLKK